MRLLVAAVAMPVLTLGWVAVRFWWPQRGRAVETPVAMAEGEGETSPEAALAPAMAGTAAAEPGEDVARAPASSEAARQRLGQAARIEVAARLVGASGMILWGIDRGGRQLRIHAAHGYPASFLQAIAPIDVGARLLTAVAFAAPGVRKRRRGGGDPAAVAAPVEHDGRVLGVLTVEFDPESCDEVTAEAALLVRLLAMQMGPGLAAEVPPAVGAPPAAPPRRRRPVKAASARFPLSSVRARVLRRVSGRRRRSPRVKRASR